MVDVVYQPAVDRKTYVITPSNDDPVSTGYDSPHTTMQKQGLRDAVDNINQESQEEHAALYPEDNQDQNSEEPYYEGDYEPESQQHPQKPRKKSKKKQDLNNYASRQREEKERLERMRAIEREEHLRELQQKEEEKQFIEQSYRLKLEEKDIDDSIQKVSNVYLDAKKDHDYEIELEAGRVLQQLDSKKLDINRNLQYLNEEANSKFAPQVSQEEKEIEEAIEAEFINFSDKRELKSPHYYEFLKEYPICNPYHEDYDRDLNKVIHGIRKELYQDLKINGESSYIGSPEYFSEVKERIAIHFNQKKSPQRRQTRNNRQFDDQDYDNYNEEDDMTYNRNRDGGGQTFIATNFGDQYDEGYAPDYDPSFRKSSDFRNEEGSFVSNDGRAVSRGAPQENPNYYRGPKGRPSQRNAQPQNREGNHRSPPTSPVSRDGYARDRRTNPRFDPAFEQQIQDTSRKMVGMVHPDGTRMNDQERYEYYRNYFANQDGDY